MGSRFFAIKRQIRLRRCVLAGSVVALLGLVRGNAWPQDLSAAVARARGTGTQGWQIRPSLSVSEHFSDNVFLASPGFERAEWTTRVSPSVSISGNSPRLRLNLLYSPELLYRANQSLTDVFHFLDANGNMELLPRTIFVDLRAAVSQQSISLLGPQPDNNINTTANRTTVKRYSISPYVSHAFGVDAVGELRLTNDAVRPSITSVGLSTSTSNRIEATLASGPAFKRTTWNLALSKARITYEEAGQKVNAESASVKIAPLVMPDTRLVGTFGYEDSGYPSTSGQQLKGTFWSVGPEWTPSPRTRVSAALGRRYFGSSRALQIDHRARHSVWTLEYSDHVTTARANLLTQAPSLLAALIDADLRNNPQFQDPQVRQAEVQNRVAATPNAGLTNAVNFLTDSLFQDKRLAGTIAIEGIRNTLLNNIYTSNRIPLSTGTGQSADFIAGQTVKQTGVSTSWTYRLNETLTSNLRLAVARNSFSSLNRKDRVTTLRWSLSKRFDPRLTGSVDLGRQQIDYAPATAGNYQENSIAVTLGLRY